MKALAQQFKDAHNLHRRTKKYVAAFLASNGTDQAAEKQIRTSVLPGLYEHWKSKEGDLKYYVVHGAGCEQDTHTPLVSYAALYAPHAGHMTFRHLVDDERGFLTPIKRDVYTGPRFRLVTTLSRNEIDILLQYVGELSIIKEYVKFHVHCRDLLKRELPLT